MKFNQSKIGLFLLMMLGLPTLSFANNDTSGLPMQELPIKLMKRLNFFFQSGGEG
jgi:hypothetical protein